MVEGVVYKSVINYRILQKDVAYKFLLHNWLYLVVIFCAIHLTNCSIKTDLNGLNSVIFS